MESTPRTLIEVENLEMYEGAEAWTNRHKPFFMWSQRDRVLLRLFRTLQFKRLVACRKFIVADLPLELKDPDPYEPEYIFYCMRLKGCSV
jgi:hypothetical protein